MTEIIIETWNLMKSKSIQVLHNRIRILAEITSRTSRLPVEKVKFLKRRLLLKGEK